MATVTGFTAARMQAIEDGTVVDGVVDGSGHLILTKHDDSTIDAGPVVGPTGPAGPAAVQGIPGEIKMWSGAVLPDEGDYGLWTWANGAAFDVVDYPIAAANIDPVWKTAHGLADPGAGKFRVPDLRGLIPAALDALPVGSGRANRTVRTAAIVLAQKTGEEVHTIALAEMPVHAHLGDDHRHANQQHDHDYWENFVSVKEGSGTAFNLQKQSMTAGTLQLRNTDVSDVFYTNYLSETGAVQNTGNAGSGSSHENMPPTVFIPYIVKLDD